MSGPRSIFEEVEGSAGARGPASTGIIDRGRAGGGAAGARRGLRLWLILLGLLVAATVLAGGIARLAGEGLVVTDWAGTMGLRPPLSEAGWQAAFDAYRQTPDFREVNPAITLAEFRGLFRGEWAHRALGLMSGAVWALGFLGFLAARKLPPGWSGRLLGIGALSCALGGFGLAMAWSGLDGPIPAPYRIAAELGLGFAALGMIAWAVFRLGLAQADLLQARRLRDGALWGMGTGLMHLAFVQLLFGALLAGIDAGRGYTDWPLMAGQLLPPYAFELEPLWRNLFENAGLVQFIHRLAGYLLALLAVGAMLRGRKAAASATRHAFLLAGLAVLLQMVLGIVALLSGVFLHAAITHQLGAVLAWLLILYARFHAGYPQPQSLRG